MIKVTRQSYILQPTVYRWRSIHSVPIV